MDNERNEMCKQYIQEIEDILDDETYFDTPIAKASRIAFVAKTWGAVTEYHGKHQWCDGCGEQKKPDELHSEDYADSKLLCEACS